MIIFIVFTVLLTVHDTLNTLSYDFEKKIYVYKNDTYFGALSETIKAILGFSLIPGWRNYEDEKTEIQLRLGSISFKIYLMAFENLG